MVTPHLPIALRTLLLFLSLCVTLFAPAEGRFLAASRPQVRREAERRERLAAGLDLCPRGCDVADFMTAREFMDTYDPAKYKTYGNVPNVVHRTLLHDEVFPDGVTSYLNTFWRNTHVREGDFISVLWRQEDAIRLVERQSTAAVQDMYKSYPKDIQRADVLRYLILDQYGGIYSDFDVELKEDLKTVIDRAYLKATGSYDWFAALETIIDEPFRNSTASRPIRQMAVEGDDKREATYRVANYFMWGAPKSKLGSRILHEVERRSKYEINMSSDYDVLFTTGPDAVSTVVNEYCNMSVAVPIFQGISNSAEHKPQGSWRVLQ